MRILITGGAGFIGSTICEKLLEQDHQVTIIDNYETGKAANNKSHKNLTIIKGSITDKKILKNGFMISKPEIVVHAAASYKNPGDWQKDIDTNIIGSINCINLSKSFEVKKFIYLQTSLSYGLNPLMKPIKSSHPLLSGGTSYAISKSAAEHYLEMSEINYVSFRLANVYGPKNLSGPLPTFYRKLKLGLPNVIVNTKRDFIFINDVVNVIVKSINGQGTKNQYNIATGKDIPIKKLFSLTKKFMTSPITSEVKEIKMGSDDVKTILLDPKETIKDFNWKIETNFFRGVKETISWYETRKIKKTSTHLKNIN